MEMGAILLVKLEQKEEFTVVDELAFAVEVKTDFALATSGISGPGGGSAAKPVGTTWVAVATPGAVHAGQYRFPGDRYRNRLLTVAAAADSLRRTLQQGSGTPPWHSSDTWCRARTDPDQSGNGPPA